MFLTWDKDRRGMLTVEEIQEHMGEICKHFSLQEPDVQKLLKALDPNDDG